MTSFAYPPDRCSIVICDFNGFTPPEMVKRRPVIVLSPRIKIRPDLCVVVCLSTTDQNPVLSFHQQIVLSPCLPPPYDSAKMWVKGDMVYSVSIQRLSWPYRKVNDSRKYIIQKLPIDQMKIVESCVMDA